MAVAPTAAGLTVAAVPIVMVAADSTAVAADPTAARVLVAGCQSHHGKWVGARIRDPVDGLFVRTPTPPSAQDTGWARMTHGA